MRIITQSLYQIILNFLYEILDNNDGFMWIKANYPFNLFGDACCQFFLVLFSFFQDKSFERILKELKHKEIGGFFSCFVDINASSEISL